MNTPKFWPLDMDPEGQIYENPAWDLPGFRRGALTRRKESKGRPATHARKMASDLSF
jgi:hypothetical protein